MLVVLHERNYQSNADNRRDLGRTVEAARNNSGLVSPVLSAEAYIAASINRDTFPECTAQCGA